MTFFSSLKGRVLFYAGIFLDSTPVQIDPVKFECRQVTSKQSCFKRGSIQADINMSARERLPRCLFRLRTRSRERGLDSNGLGLARFGATHLAINSYLVQLSLPLESTNISTSDLDHKEWGFHPNKQNSLFPWLLYDLKLNYNLCAEDKFDADADAEHVLAICFLFPRRKISQNILRPPPP